MWHRKKALVVLLWLLAAYAPSHVPAPQQGLVYYYPPPEIAAELESAITAIAQDNYRPSEANYHSFYASLYNPLFREERSPYLVTKIKDHLGKDSHLRLLDAGCGTGTESRILSHSYQIICMDSSPAMLQVARALNPWGQYLLGDIVNEAVFSPHSFDAILSLYDAMFYHPDPRLALHNFAAWLTPGGLFFIDIMDMAKYLTYTSRRPAFEHTWDRDIRFNDHRITFHGYWSWHDGDEVRFHELFTIDGAQKFSHVHKLYIPRLSRFIELAAEAGLHLIERYDMADIGDRGEIFFVFKKRA